MESLRIRAPRPSNNNDNANTPLPEGHTMEPLFSSNEHQYRSNAFLIKNRGKTVSFKKKANRNRGPIYNESKKEIRVYEKLREAPDWKEYIAHFREGSVLNRRVTLRFNYIPGGDLISFVSEFIEKLGDADVTASNASIFFKLFADIARALNFLYKNGVAHGDIKPDNIYVDEGRVPHARLLDLGQSVIAAHDNKVAFENASDSDIFRYVKMVCEGILVNSFHLNARYIIKLTDTLEKVEGRSHQYKAAAAYWDGLYEEYKPRRVPGNPSMSTRSTRRINRDYENSRHPHVAISMQ